ncbi:hypothetical protein YC2023_077640 [Brassica napus]
MNDETPGVNEWKFLTLKRESVHISTEIPANKIIRTCHLISDPSSTMLSLDESESSDVKLKKARAAVSTYREANESCCRQLKIEGDALQGFSGTEKEIVKMIKTLMMMNLWYVELEMMFSSEFIGHMKLIDEHHLQQRPVLDMITGKEIGRSGSAQCLPPDSRVFIDNEVSRPIQYLSWSVLLL